VWSLDKQTIQKPKITAVATVPRTIRMRFELLGRVSSVAALVMNKQTNGGFDNTMAA